MQEKELRPVASRTSCRSLDSCGESFFVLEVPDEGGSLITFLKKKGVMVSFHKL